jgi:hypothetical protein
VRLPDPVDAEAVDGRPERVPDGRSQQGAAHPAAEVLLLGTAPDGA